MTGPLAAAADGASCRTGAVAVLFAQPEAPTPMTSTRNAAARQSTERLRRRADRATTTCRRANPRDGCRADGFFATALAWHGAGRVSFVPDTIGTTEAHDTGVPGGSAVQVYGREERAPLFDLARAAKHCRTRRRRTYPARVLPAPASLRDLCVAAIDVEWTHGPGPHVRGPAEALLFTVAGRPQALADLGKPGLATLAQRASGTGGAVPHEVVLRRL